VFLFVGIALLGFGVGLATLVIGHRLPIVAWVMKMFLRRILLWTSCIFFSISIIPDAFRPWILWNPIAHGVELLRQACNPAYPIPGVSALYFWCGWWGHLAWDCLSTAITKSCCLSLKSHQRRSQVGRTTRR
jgi:ABC-type polysaccharide/polyol phosphate export permease